MQYLGGKSKIANELLKIMLPERKNGQVWCEPFVGGCNVIDKVTGVRIAGDIHKELISFYQALQKGWEPPKNISEEHYLRIKESNDLVLKGYAGFAMSFGGKYFGGFRRVKKEDKKGNYANIDTNNRRAWNSVMTQRPLIKDVYFYCCHYSELPIPPKSFIYCDPPYQNVTGYSNPFSHINFWTWCRIKKEKGHTIYISCNTAPKDFQIVWEKSIRKSGGNNSARMLDRLYTL